MLATGYTGMHPVPALIATGMMIRTGASSAKHVPTVTMNATGRSPVLTMMTRISGCMESMRTLNATAVMPVSAMRIYQKTATAATGLMMCMPGASATIAPIVTVKANGRGFSLSMTPARIFRFRMVTGRCNAGPATTVNRWMTSPGLTASVVILMMMITRDVMAASANHVMCRRVGPR